MDQIHQALDFPIDFEVYEFSELRAAASFKRFSYTIDPVGRKLIIEGSRNKNIDTIFGGNSSDPIILEEERVAKLPHDLVHACLHGVPEGMINLSGYTPDICIPVENGKYDVLEITTVESGRLKDVSAAMSNKIEKYGPLTRGPSPQINRLNVLVVTPDAAFDLNGPIIDRHFQSKVTLAYSFGLEIAREYADNPGFKESGKFSKEEVKMLQEEFIRIGWKEDGHISKSYFERSIPDHPLLWKISQRSFEKSHKTFDMYEAEMRARVEQRDEGMGTIVHVPMVLVEERLQEWSPGERSDLENVYANIFNHCLAQGLRVSTSKDFETLRMLSEMDNDPKPKRQPVRGPDMIHVLLSGEEKLELAERGVLAAKHGLTTDPYIAELRAEAKLDINYDEDLGNLSLYLSSDMQLSENPCITFSEIEHCFDKKVFLDVKPLMRDLSRVPEIKALNFLDKVMKEISFNLVRSPRDSEQGRNFLFRMIPGYHAFVVIRNTSPASQDQSHIFYSIFFKGKELAEGVFEDTFELDNGWRYTKFLSTDQLRLSQYQNVDLNCLFHWFAMIDEGVDPDTGVGDGISPDTTIEQFMKYKAAFRMTMMILLEDKQITSSTLQDFRYYYMELNTAFRSSYFRSQKLTSKLPRMIRSRLLLYIVRTLIQIHRDLPEYIVEKITKMDSDGMPINADEMDEEDVLEYIDADGRADLEKASFNIASGIDTPFHFKINTPADMVRAMYMGYMHNKNEGFRGHGVVKMLEKTLKMAYLWKDLKIDDPENYCAQNHSDPDLMKPYQHSAPAVKVGCDLLKRRLMKRVNLPMSKYDDYITEKVLKFSLKSRLEDLATTKASTVPFDDVQINDSEGQEIKDIGKKRKCIEAVLVSWSDYKSPLTAMNVGTVLTAFNIVENGRIRVTLFRKNQIGGTREIYVLTIRGRILTKIFSDLFRAICELHPSEVLTKPENKSTFVGNHYMQRKELKGRFKATYKSSEDKTTWAQLFNLYSFGDMCKELLPKFLWPFCQHVLAAHKDKMLQLPRSLIEQFLNSPLSELSSENVQRLKAEFLGKSDACLLSNKHCTSFANEIDMMQGILHYPSSCYHLVFAEYQTVLTSKWFEGQGVDCLVEFLVSSDDEGGLISFSSDDKEHLRKVMGRFHNAYGRIKNTIDKLFGIETSDNKTSRTYSDIFEINSEFYFGNTCQRALSKFENNALYLEPGESLHLQITALYAKLRELRAAGGSGALCHVASTLQCLAFTRAIGVGSMGWYQQGLYQHLTNSLTTTSGYYFIFNELKAGLMDAAYVNWRAVRERGESAAKIIYFLNNYALPLTEAEYVSAKFSIYPRDKYRQMLRRLGLTLGDQERIMDDDLFEQLMTGARDIDGERKVIEYMVLTPSIARSLSYLNRTHVDRMAPYVLWSAMYRDPSNSQKYSLLKLLKRAEGSPVDPDLINIKVLFPMSDQFSRISELDGLDYVVSGPLTYRRLYSCHISPQYYSEDCIKHMKEVLSFIWFHKRPSLSKRQCNDMFLELQALMPWLDRDLTITKKKMPLKNLHELYAFISSSRGVVSSFSALVRGRPRKSFSSVQALIRNNVFTRRVVHSPEIIIPEDTIEPQTGLAGLYAAQKIGDRIRAWKDLLQESREGDSVESAELRELALEDFRFMSSTLTSKQKTHVMGNTEEDRITKDIALMSGEMSVSSYFRLVKEAVLYLSVQEKVGRSWSGDYSFVHKRGSFIAQIKYIGKAVLVQANCSREDFIREYKITPDTFERFRIGLPDVTIKEVGWRKGNLLLVFGKDVEYYMNIPRTHVRQIHFSRPNSPLLAVLEKWLSRGDVASRELYSMLTSGMNDRGLFGLVVRSLLRICKHNERSITRTRLAEKLEQSSMPVEESDFLHGSLTDLIDILADNLGQEAPDLEDFIDIFDTFVNDQEQDWTRRAAGMEATALESFTSLMESNRTLFTMLKMLKSFQTMDHIFLAPEVRQALKVYKDLR